MPKTEFEFRFFRCQRNLDAKKKRFRSEHKTLIYRKTKKLFKSRSRVADLNVLKGSWKVFNSVERQQLLRANKEVVTSLSIEAIANKMT